MFVICNRCGHSGTITLAGNMRHMTPREMETLKARPWYPRMKAHQESILAKLVG
jgi:hypothetical protein